MAKITRTTQKIFAGNANADQTAVFGSMKTGTGTYTKNIADLMGSTAFGQGFGDALVANYAPFMEEMNGINLATTQQLAYILQEGIAEYDAGTTYFKGSIVKQTVGTDTNLYSSLVDNNTGNALTDTTKWKLRDYAELSGNNAFTGNNTFSGALNCKSEDIDIENLSIGIKYLSIVDKNNAELGRFQTNTSVNGNISCGIVAPREAQGGLTNLNYFYVLSKSGGSGGANASADVKRDIVGWAMPSSRYTDLTLGANGTTYTAPANGWFTLDKTANGAQYVALRTDKNIGIRVSSHTSVSIMCYVPVKKDDVCTVLYDASGTLNYFKFVYAEGDE